ncbi:lycopene cyclase domain-containing protein [Salinimicrobium soli]|uniref:lycopene cyclase domain-containing protein n=1 Tax=Salinimicrobium soli TaxID=1254399 RepID=UPI003AAD1BD8
MEYTYLLVNFFTILVPFLFSFHPKLRFDKTWGAFFPAVFFTGLLFVLWDMWFTSMGVWGFNERYLTGINIGNLPLEEVLFFFCIPYACVFTFHCLDLLLRKKVGQKGQMNTTLFFASILLIIGVLNLDKYYTASTFLSLGILLLISEFLFKIPWLKRFYIVYAVLLIPFFIVNGVLTGTGIEEEVVWYNSEEFMGIRLLTIPVEDIFYGMELILLNLLIYRFLLSRRKVPSLQHRNSRVSQNIL